MNEQQGNKPAPDNRSMTEKKRDEARQAPRVQKTFGVPVSEFLAALNGKSVTVTLMTGKAFSGRMLSNDVYDILISQPSGLTLMIPKHSIALLHASNGAATNGAS